MFRSDKFRRAVADLACVNCGAEHHTQAAHANQGKGMGIKSSDATCMALCVNCHRELDQPGLNARPKAERREFEKEMNLRTLHRLIEAGFMVIK